MRDNDRLPDELFGADEGSEGEEKNDSKTMIEPVGEIIVGLVELSHLPESIGDERGHSSRENRDFARCSRLLPRPVRHTDDDTLARSREGRKIKRQEQRDSYVTGFFNTKK